MAAPDFDWYENDSNQFGAGTPLTSLNKIEIGLTPLGSIGIPTDPAQQIIHLWNDKGGVALSDAATSIKLFATAADVNHPAFAGTVGNSFHSIIEARSRGAYNASADTQEIWTPIGPSQFLLLGDMPRNSRREIEVRVRPPADYVPHAIADFQLAVTWG